MIDYKADIYFAAEMDANDPLGAYRDKFLFPNAKEGNPCLYFCGNSLGLQPKITQSVIQEELEDWATLGIEGYFSGRHPWVEYHTYMEETMADVVGAKRSEVVIMNTLTANLHLLMVSFYQPKGSKNKILIESDAFPSDRYAVESQLKFHGYDPSNHLVEWTPRPGEELLRLEDLEEILNAEGDKIAMLLIGGVNYYTGQYLDLKAIANIGHKHGCIVGIDLAHGAGNIQPDLHDSGVDYAAWCNYKYLNSGPGSIGAAFVHEKHEYNPNLHRFAGWWNHNKKTRFNMRVPFDVLRGAEGWQLSCPPVFSMAPIRASMSLFKEAGMPALRDKSIKLTGYLEFLINKLSNDKINIITPHNPSERGCQLSIQVKDSDKALYQMLKERNVIVDWREPDVIRCAPVPLYNSFQDVNNFVEILEDALKS